MSKLISPFFRSSFDCSHFIFHFHAIYSLEITGMKSCFFFERHLILDCTSENIHIAKRDVMKDVLVRLINVVLKQTFSAFLHDDDFPVLPMECFKRHEDTSLTTFLPDSLYTFIFHIFSIFSFLINETRTEGWKLKFVIVRRCLSSQLVFVWRVDMQF